MEDYFKDVTFVLTRLWVSDFLSIFSSQLSSLFLISSSGLLHRTSLYVPDLLLFCSDSEVTSTDQSLLKISYPFNTSLSDSFSLPLSLTPCPSIYSCSGPLMPSGFMFYKVFWDKGGLAFPISIVTINGRSKTSEHYTIAHSSWGHHQRASPENMLGSQKSLRKPKSELLR